MSNRQPGTDGIPRAPFVERTTPAAHRTNVTAADSDDPADPSNDAAAGGYATVDFDLDVPLGGTNPLVEAAPIYYDATTNSWYQGESAFFAKSGRYRLRAEARGATVYLKVIALTGTGATLDLDAQVSLS